MSADGQAWQTAGETEYRSLHGDAVVCGALPTSRFVRVAFLTPDGAPANVPCDEIEVYTAAP